MLNKLDPWGIVHYGEVGIENLKEEVEGYVDEWLLDLSRQTNNKTHEKTFMFQLQDFNLDWRPGTSGRSLIKNSLKNDASRDELSKIYEKIEKSMNGKVLAAEIINMNPRSRIRTHKDRSDFLFVARRFHVPIKTNTQTIFKVHDDSVNMLEGNLYEINNSKYHSVVNNSYENRIHLIFDLLPNEYMEGVVIDSDQ